MHAATLRGKTTLFARSALLLRVYAPAKSSSGLVCCGVPRHAWLSPALSSDRDVEEGYVFV
jgi:hypothetical protein